MGWYLLKPWHSASRQIGGASSGAVPWTLDKGRAGILVDVTSAVALAEAMTHLALHFDERIEWGLKGKEMVTRRFHIRAIADAYELIYRELQSQTLNVTTGIRFTQTETPPAKGENR